MSDSKDTGRIKLTKIDVARRQLETAILLYFNEADPISIHTLAAAAHEVLRDLGSQKDSQMLLERSVSHLPRELRDFIQKMMRIPQNFFKHADRDAEETLDFAPGLTELTLLDAMVKYMELTGEQTVMLRAYEKWFSLQHPEFWDHTPLRDVLRQAKSELGTLNRIGFLSQFLATGLSLVGAPPNPAAQPDVQRTDVRRPYG